MHRMAREQTVVCILGTAQIVHLDHCDFKCLTTYMGKLFGCETVLIKSFRCNSIQISLKGQITKNKLFTFVSFQTCRTYFCRTQKRYFEQCFSPMQLKYLIVQRLCTKKTNKQKTKLNLKTKEKKTKTKN